MVIRNQKISNGAALPNGEQSTNNLISLIRTPYQRHSKLIRMAKNLIQKWEGRGRREERGGGRRGEGENPMQRL